MAIRHFAFFLGTFGFLLIQTDVSLAQDQTASRTEATQQQPASKQKEEATVKRERKAVALLEEVVSTAQSLKLPDRALQIATDHLDESTRKTVMQAIELKKMVLDGSPERLAKFRQKLAALPSDSARVTAIIDMAVATAKDDQKLALKLLDDARNIVSKRARSYQDFGDQLKVAEAFASLDLKQSFELLESGIAQLNEILAAAAVVNGFEAEVFREGELPLRGGSELGNMVARYGSELGALAKLDFDGARMTADKFQLTEARLLTRLLIAQQVLGGQENSFDDKLRD